MNVSQIDIKTEDTEALLTELKWLVKIRNTMGGAMHFNMVNDDVIAVANRLRALGAPVKIVKQILSN